MTFIHIADLHASKGRREKCLEVLDKIESYIKSLNEKPVLLVAGDFWDASITAGPTYASFLSKMKEIQNIADVIMVYGTVTHEPADSLKGFELIGCHVYAENTFIDFDNWELVALPEPRKSNYISGLKEGEDINEHINKSIDGFISSLPKKKKPRIVVAHGEIAGVLFDSSLPCDSPIAFKQNQLKKINADYYAFGHIHNKQEVFPNCWYSGSCFQKSFAETHDPGMIIVNIGDDK